MPANSRARVLTHIPWWSRFNSAAGYRVDMRTLEGRNNELSRDTVHPSVRPDEASKLIGAANSHDPVAVNRDVGAYGSLKPSAEDPSVLKYRIGES